jgi:K+-transporting ATPase ATPase B chain
MAAKTHSIFEPAIVVPAIAESFKKLNPLHMVKNPVMFVTEVGAAVTTVLMFSGTQGAPLASCCRSPWLWFTVLFANFAEAMAEGRARRRPTRCARRAPRPSPIASKAIQPEGVCRGLA